MTTDQFPSIHNDDLSDAPSANRGLPLRIWYTGSTDMREQEYIKKLVELGRSA